MDLSRRLAALVLTLFAIALSAASAGAATASAAGPEYRGVHLHSLWWDSSDADMDRELDLARDLGGNVVRVDVGWDSLETGGKGNYSQWYLEKLDRFVNGASARGLKVIATLTSTPCWASSAPESLKQGCAGEWWGRNVQLYPPTRASDYGDIARFVTSRYGTKLAALEVWNEPNLDVDRFFIAPDEPAAYAAILKAAYPAAKQGNADVEVLAGSLAYMNGAFLERLYALGIQGYYDGLAVHPYNDAAPTAANWSGVQWARRLQRAAGDTKPLWITEFGWSTCRIGSGWCKSEADQASHTTAGFAALASDPGVKAAVVYNLRDKGTTPTDMEQNFGLVGRDFTPKPAYTALRAAFTAPSGSSAPPAPAPAPASAPASAPAPAPAPAPSPSPALSPPTVPDTVPAPPATGPVAVAPGVSGSGASREASATTRSGRPAAGGRVRVKVRHRRGVTVASGRAPRGARVVLRTTGCRRAEVARMRTIRVGASGRFSQSLGSAKRLAGCRVVARLASR